MFSHRLLGLRLAARGAIVATAVLSLHIADTSAATEKAAESELTKELKRDCTRHFPGMIQAEVRAACTSAATGLERHGKSGAQVRCRLDYGEEPRDVMACLIGTDVADDLASKKDDYKKKLQLCAELYPMHTEVDAFLQESCLTGIHLPKLLSEKPRLELCTQINPERSFQGPCAAGMSLSDAAPTVQPSQQNKLCEQYFDHKKFHSGYRACLSARSLALDWTGKASDIMKICDKVITDGENETARAACMVGASIHRSLSAQGDVSKRFQKCGDNKVSYEDRDFLACLTAASLLDFTDKNGAEMGCKELYKDSKSRGRGDCLNSLPLF